MCHHFPFAGEDECRDKLNDVPKPWVPVSKQDSWEVPKDSSIPDGNTCWLPNEAHWAKTQSG